MDALALHSTVERSGIRKYYLFQLYMLTISIIFFFVVTSIDSFAMCMVAVFICTIYSCYMLIYQRGFFFFFFADLSM